VSSLQPSSFPAFIPLECLLASRGEHSRTTSGYPPWLARTPGRTLPLYTVHRCTSARKGTVLERFFPGSLALVLLPRLLLTSRALVLPAVPCRGGSSLERAGAEGEGELSDTGESGCGAAAEAAAAARGGGQCAPPGEGTTSAPPPTAPTLLPETGSTVFSMNP